MIASAPARALPAAMEAAGMEWLVAPLLQRVTESARPPHGDREQWRDIIAQLPAVAASSYDFSSPVVRIGARGDCDDATRELIKSLLLRLKPWRKGPFELFGLLIDSEWRANLKWGRLAAAIKPLRDRRVLDVGCGNGYYLLRMLGAGARFALGLEPAELFVAQFDALRRYRSPDAAFILPLRCEQFPAERNFAARGFDSVFSMGVLYHRRDPHAHLRQLLNFARGGGEVVVESLLINGDANTVLTPNYRYAKMRNVHCIPSALALESWLRRAGATNIRLVDASATMPHEQRATEWMPYESLADFLDPVEQRKTIEGYPAPRRGIFICERSG